ncbi:hypothetical protein ILUMI_03422 [Ignelater luminosus]|uniref:Uncharacterized protein n=1 Tax=Ignelater luminosus TaxID=2038154 RepID=A0A8K0GIB9_IGNLU|nr:hypothetical protein ILUMI_03422 [Ignelater luminosus]
MGFCDLLGFLFVSYCVRQRSAVKKPPEKFQMEFQWSHINFTWPSVDAYHNAVLESKYIPENNAMAGIKYFNNRMYIALPRIRTGTPVTLAYVPINARLKTNVLLRPYPSWEMNAQPNNCSTLQNVQSMEIDKYGVMWILDGVRINNLTRCPPKIVLMDLRNNGKILQSHNVPNEICLHQGGFLNDLVVDESDGGFAYITDNSIQDPGIIVYSRHQNRSWKFRDASMFGELDAAEFEVDGVPNDILIPVDGITMAPMPLRRNEDRLVYYCALSGFSIYAISSQILRDEAICKSGIWRSEVEMVGRKQSQSDGLAMDNKGNLYYGMLSMYGVGKWNIKKPFNTARKVDTSRRTFVWPDSFSFDLNGNLYILTNGINKYFSPTYELRLSTDIKFRILRLTTGTKSYLYS